MSYGVSRQRYWGVDEENGTVVEVAAGGLDYANPDMLVPRWPKLGEGQEYLDPTEAAAAAIRVCDAWREAGETLAQVAYGATGGNTMPFDPCTYEELNTWAEQRLESLPKCVRCGDILGKKTYKMQDDPFEQVFCSDNCATIAYEESCAEAEPDDFDGAEALEATLTDIEP